MNFECQGKREPNPSLTKFEQRIPIWTNLNQLLTASEEEKDPFKTLSLSLLFSLSVNFSLSLSQHSRSTKLLEKETDSRSGYNSIFSSNLSLPLSLLVSLSLSLSFSLSQSFPL